MTFTQGTEIEVTENGLEAFKVLDLYFDKKEKKYYMSSGTYPTRWPHRKEVKAQCNCDRRTSVNDVLVYEDNSKDPEAPVQGHMCGIHCERKLEQCIAYVSTATKETEDELKLGSLAVRLSIWGKILEGEHGYRAQYAYPNAIYLPANKAADIGAPICDVYGCQILTEESGDPYVADVIEKMRQASRGFKRLTINEKPTIDIPVPSFIHELAKHDHELSKLGKQVEDEVYLEKVKTLIGLVKDGEANKGRLIAKSTLPKEYPVQEEISDGETRDD
jgi:hypothetical protein